MFATYSWIHHKVNRALYPCFDLYCIICLECICGTEAQILMSVALDLQPGRQAGRQARKQEGGNSPMKSDSKSHAQMVLTIMPRRSRPMSFMCACQMHGLTPVVAFLAITTLLVDMVPWTDALPPALHVHLTEWKTLPTGVIVSCPERRRRLRMEAWEKNREKDVIDQHWRQEVGGANLHALSSALDLQVQAASDSPSTQQERSDSKEVEHAGRRLSSSTATDDVSVLLAIKEAIFYDPRSVLSNWTNSKNSDHCRTWAGVTCNSKRQVVSLSLPGCQLNGTLSPQIGNLTQLTYLNFSSNNLSGSIPSELMNCHNLSVLDVSVNLLSGIVPPQLGNLSQLQVLWLSNNTFSSSIPEALGNSCQKLTSLQADFANLSGTIPTSLGKCQNLIFLSFFYNNLTGNIPTTLGNLQLLQQLWLKGNSLTGSIPASLAKCKSMEYLILSVNSLSGSLPTEFGGLGQLQALIVFGNQLSGKIPASLGRCRNMTELGLDSNNFTGERTSRPRSFC